VAKHRRIILISGLAFVLASPLLATTRIDLNHDWLFRTDPEQKGERFGWQRDLPGDTEPVNIPHTWNIGKYDSYLGPAWYFRTLEMPVHLSNVRVELHFGATFYKARIWLNGVEIGSHEGGYTEYSFDLTPLLRHKNYLAVEIDNRIASDTVPGFAMRQRSPLAAWYDWWDYGGMVRDVWLTLGGSIQVRRQQIRSRIDEGSATVQDQVFLENRSARSKQLSIHAEAFDPDNQLAASETRFVQVRLGRTETSISLRLAVPRLWGIDHPNVYRMKVTVVDLGRRVLDEHTDTFGIRTIEIRDRHLLINGERVRLTGVTRHEESIWEGLAETPGTMRYDYDDLKALQVTLTRPVHYPQNPFILDYADRHGILLIPEIPVWQFSEAQLSNPKVLRQAQQEMREMIEQAGNHPSIFAWSVCNESATATPGGVAYFLAMRDFIRILDPGRFVSYADDNLSRLKQARDSAANEADFLMMNQYFGSWHGREDELSAALGKIDRMFPNKMMIVSEFGLPGIFGKDAEDADRMRVRIIHEQLPELARRDWIAGAILWCYQDYKSRRNLRPGLEEGYVDHGVVDEYRQRRPSYYVWKEMNAPAAVDAQWKETWGGEPTGFTVTITPNAPESLPSYPLYGYKLDWDVRDQNSELLATGEQELSDLSHIRIVEGNVPMTPGSSELRLHLMLLRPIGTVAAERTVPWPGSPAAERPANTIPEKSGLATH
jgi:beta-glucuronidase